MCKCVNVFASFCNVVCTLSGLKLTVHSICAFFRGTIEQMKNKIYMFRIYLKKGKKKEVVEIIIALKCTL